jgi:hypothetical protein
MENLKINTEFETNRKSVNHFFKDGGDKRNVRSVLTRMTDKQFADRGLAVLTHNNGQNEIYDFSSNFAQAGVKVSSKHRLTIEEDIDWTHPEYSTAKAERIEFFSRFVNERIATRREAAISHYSLYRLLNESEPSWLADAKRRIDELETLAVDESVDFSKASAVDANRFLKTCANMRKPSIFLLGNGNLRVLWTKNQTEQVGLQFRGNGIIQFVFFVRRKEIVAESYGIDQPENVKKMFTDHDTWQIISR